MTASAAFLLLTEEIVIAPVLLQSGYSIQFLNNYFFSNKKGESVHYFREDCKIFSEEYF